MSHLHDTRRMFFQKKSQKAWLRLKQTNKNKLCYTQSCSDAVGCSVRCAKSVWILPASILGFWQPCVRWIKMVHIIAMDWTNSGDCSNTNGIQIYKLFSFLVGSFERLYYALPLPIFLRDKNLFVWKNKVEKYN